MSLTNLKDMLINTATNTIGMADDIVTGTRQLTKAYGHGTSILCKHAAYYDKLHDEHNAIKSEELATAITTRSQAVQDLLAKSAAKLANKA